MTITFSHAALTTAAIFLAAFATTSATIAGDETARPIVSPAHDDANLNDVTFVAGQIGWAVGDRGVAWQTEDGGVTFQHRPMRTDAALCSVSFLTDRIGWIAGGETTPFTRVGVGTLLATTDGGRTWTDVAPGRFPRIRFVRFFSPSDGVIVGDAATDSPTGMWTTHDGGKTWTGIPGESRGIWRAAHFLSTEVGIAVGLSGATARIDGTVSTPRVSLGSRSLQSATLAGDVGWTVGDGGLILSTANRGVIWKGPTTPLPPEAAGIFDFKTVCARGEKVWIAGSPGSVVWHSPDGGASWVPQRTGQTAPLSRIAVASDSLGWAVGAFGLILRTQDGGAHWTAVRGSGRRAALLALSLRADEIAFRLIAQQGAELGYRSVVLLPFRGDGSGDAAINHDLDFRLHDAVIAAGGNQGLVGWRLPLEIPGIDRDAARLRDEWMRRTEGNLRPALQGDLVCRIRTWRPSAIVVPKPDARDAAGTILAQVVAEAVREAADPAAFPEQSDVAALSPWETTRLFARVAPAEGDLSIDSDGVLSRAKSTVGAIASAAAGLVRPVDALAAEKESFRLVYPNGPEPRPANEPTLRDLLSGIGIAPDSAARRMRLPQTAEDESTRKTAAFDKRQRAIARLRGASETNGAELIGHLRGARSGPDSAAAAQLALLADGYRRRRQWELTEATLSELIGRYPREPVAQDAMEWLFHYWVGVEPTWQRMQGHHVNEVRPRFDGARVVPAIEQALALAQTPVDERDPTARVPQAPAARIDRHIGRLQTPAGDLAGASTRAQKEAALQLARLIRRSSPALFRSPQIQLPLASLLAQTGLKSLPAEDGERVESAASGVIPAGYAMPAAPSQKTVKCLPAARPPVIDGLLSDECWQEAHEIPLLSDDAGSEPDGPHALVMLAYDAQNLYFAISAPRLAGPPADPPMSLGRTRDADLSRYDRVALYLDLDRDYFTWYQIEIDSRGCVYDDCWHDPAWNPRLAVRAQADGDRWRIEGAIPFRELTGRSPTRGEAWGLAAIRTAPAVRLESWMRPASARVRPESFGTLRFD